MVRRTIIAFLLFALFFPGAVLAQQNDTTPAGVSEEAAEALGEDRGKTEEEQLQEILSDQRNEYDLISSGNYKIDYDVTYSFNSNPRTSIISQSDTGFVINELTRDAQHTINQRINLRYGLLNNLTTGMSIPLVAKYNAATDRSVTAFGDVTLSSRYQPYVVRSGQLRMTYFGNLSLPTGRSPFEIDRDQELSTGSGLYRLGAGFNFSRAFDPVVAFGSLSLNYSLPVDDLNQNRGRNRILKEVSPGPALSWGLGMAYSLSYDVSLTYSLNYSISFPSDFTFRDLSTGTIQTVESNPTTSSTFNIGTGWRLSPQYQMSLGAGIGLTDNSPDFSFRLGFPLVLEKPVIVQEYEKMLSEMLHF